MKLTNDLASEKYIFKLENIMALAKQAVHGVEIPQVLINKLAPFGPRFIKVEAPMAGDPKSGKRAVEYGFQNHPYEANDKQLQDWLAVGGNYAILAGKALILIDTDTRKANNKLKDIRTLKTRSGSGRGYGHIFMSDVTENGTIIDPKQKDPKKRNIGNIQTTNKYIVGPGCLHYTGGLYKIIDDSPIAYISKKELEERFGDMLVWARQKRNQLEEQAKFEEEQIGTIIPLKEVIDMSELTSIGKGEFRGAHPIHGSMTGQNFCVNLEKNVWHCFRCNSGGGGLMWIAVENGLLECHEAQKGALKGKKFFEALEIAQKKGFNVKLPDEELNPDVARFFKKLNGKRKFVPARLALELIQENRYVTRASDKMIFRYNPDRGIYEMDADIYIGKEIVKKLGEHYTTNRHREVEAYLKIKTTERLPSLPKGLIAVQNGVLNVFTRELKPFSPNYFVVNALPWKYDKNAKCQRYLKFMKEVVPEPKDVKGLQEFLGYCLLPDCRYEKALMLIGVGANGKSTMLKTWMLFLGKENVSVTPLQILVIDRFALADLFGKMANVYSDLPSIALKDTGYFKMLVSGERMSAQEKYKGRFNFDNIAKLLFSANEVPATPDDTDAYFRRWLMVTYPNQFLDDNPKTDKNMLEKLTTPEEMTGILNWALDGLEQLLKQNKFTTSKTNEEVREQYTLLSNPQKAFVQAHLTTMHGATLTKTAAYNAYTKFCNEHNLPAVSRQIFSTRLPQYIPCADDRARIRGKQTRVWKNIALKNSTSIFKGLAI